MNWEWILIDWYLYGLLLFHTLFYQLKGDQILTAILHWVKVLLITYFSKTMA
jgi:hypothetical protein